MMDDKLLNILSNSNKDIDNQKLMDYLSGKLSADEKHEVEEQMADSDFMNDAVEGLEDVKNKKELSFFIEQLNSDLHKQLEKKKKRKLKHVLKDQPWLYLAIILLLLLSIISFIVIKKSLENEKHLHPNLPRTEQK
jgi:ABC-type bacteriocin/lantibiotic exporter with double-glycine peptidase domain